MLVRSFAAYLGVPFLKVDCSAVRTADDWSGSFRQDPNTKTWAHKWSPFALALRAGQPCVILLDDLTRTETPAALNALIGLLDETGTLLVPDANATLTLPKGIMVVATANIGPEFVGTLPLDGAIRQRFPYGVRMDYPTEAIEAKLLVDRCGISRETADALVRMAVQQRTHRDDAQLYPSGSVVSTRLLLAIGDALSENVEPRTAIWSVLKGQFDKADEAALTVVVDTQFPKVPVPSAPTPGNPAMFITERHYYSSISGADCDYLFSDGSVCNRQHVDPIHL
jgi:MoxR-like ATPase